MDEKQDGNLKVPGSSLTAAFFNILYHYLLYVNADAINPGAGYFASGDAYYKFRCRPVQARAIKRSDCYAGLPVCLQEGDLQRNNAVRNPSSSDRSKLFLGARTHLLTKIGIRIPCVRQMAPVFRGEQGQWICASPELSISVTPTVLKVLDQDVVATARSGEVWNEFDLEEGGIYKKETFLSLESRL